MKTILGELDTKDRFNILMFNDKIEFYKQESLQANEENVKKAIAYVDTLSAMGGIGFIYLTVMNDYCGCSFYLYTWLQERIFTMH